METALFSGILYVAINEAIYGGLTPYTADSAGETATDASFPAATPTAPTGSWRSSSTASTACSAGRPSSRSSSWESGGSGASIATSLSRALADVARSSSPAGLCALVLAVQLLVAGFLAPTMFGFWFPPRHLLAALPLAVPLVALGLGTRRRRVRRSRR